MKLEYLNIIGKIIYISCYGPYVTHIVLFSSDIPSPKRVHKENLKKKLKDFLRECVDLESEPYDSKKKLHIIDSSTLSYFLLLICGDTI